MLPNNMDTTTDKDTSNQNINDNDSQQKVEKLLAQITELKSENQKSYEEFGIQRGKMKELFLHKEEELKRLERAVKVAEDERDEARSQATVMSLELEARLSEERSKYQSEISTLHTLVNATLEEASRYEKEIRELKSRNGELEAELRLSGGGESVLATSGAMLSTLARKVVSGLGAVDPHHAPPDSLEESMNKAKEDAEVLKSLVVPLEEEITALKSKLRATDELLQKYKSLEEKAQLPGVIPSTEAPQLKDEEAQTVSNCSADGSLLSTPEESVRSKEKSTDCEMCLNYEHELVESQRRVTELERELSVMDRLKEELQKESVFRKQMEEKWSESKEQHKQEVTELEDKMKTSEAGLSELKSTFDRTRGEILKEFSRLSEERRTTHQRLQRLQSENENLVGKYNAHSQDLQNEEINLPNSVEGLQELWLGQREELIKARVGLEHSEEMVKTLECLCAVSEEKQQQLHDQIAKLQSDIFRWETASSQRQARLLRTEEALKEKKKEIEELKTCLQKLHAEKKKLEESESELRTRLISLQTGLENGEAVQKDFVRLSQSLQKELERLRGQNNVLRWEHEEDVTECRGCEQSFKSSKGKANCRHCGRIFCGSCLSHKVYTGRSGRESRVCQVCHTLLDSETAPYFSTGPPKSN